MAIMEHSLETLVGSALMQSPYLATKNLRFETHQGRVVLLGKVNSYYQKQMAQETVRRLDGVHHVENHLEVTWA